MNLIIMFIINYYIYKLIVCTIISAVHVIAEDCSPAKAFTEEQLAFRKKIENDPNIIWFGGMKR